MLNGHDCQVECSTMNTTTLYVILAIALGLLVGFVLVMYLLRPLPPTFNAHASGVTVSHITDISRRFNAS